IRDFHVPGVQTWALPIFESPAALLAIESSNAYRGRYFVLMGHLSPIDGIGPSELGLELLEQRLLEREIEEMIVATSVTVEGDARSEERRVGNAGRPPRPA